MKLGRSLSFALACALLAGAAQAQTTWIVDDDGGPGVNFTNIQPAIDAASSGDVIRVFPGNYTGFTLDKALVIVGQPSKTVSVQGQGIVRGISAPQKVVLSRLSTNTWKLENCTGAVLLDRCDGLTQVVFPYKPGLSSTNCADVRIQHSAYRGPDYNGFPAIAGSQSRIQLNDCWAQGGKGNDGLANSCDGKPGGAGVDGFSAVVHVYRSWIQGGNGGSEYPAYCSGYGGDGGDAVRGTSVLAAGQAPATPHYLLGGMGGFGTKGGYQYGTPGKALLCGNARYSGVSLGGAVVAGSVTIPVPPDPTLSFKTPQPVAGEPLRFMVHGPQDAIVTLLIGREPVLVAPTALKERRLVTLDQDRAPVGVIDGSGLLITKIELPSTAPPGFTFLVQAELVYPDGETRYTNSLTVVLP